MVRVVSLMAMIRSMDSVREKIPDARPTMAPDTPTIMDVRPFFLISVASQAFRFLI